MKSETKKPEKKIFRKSEKYITERISKAGAHSLEICIRKNGQQFRRSVLVSEFATSKQAMQFAKNLRDETLVKLEAGYTVSNFKTVGELYQKTFELLPVSVKTKKKHDIFYRAAIEEYADVEINRVTSADIQKSLNQYAKEQTKRQVVGLLAVWRRIYKVCALSNIAIPNRTEAVIMPKCKPDSHREISIDKDDLDTFCEALLQYNTQSAKGYYYARSVYYAIQIMLYCGLRPAETFALTAADIDLIGGTISVNKAVRSSTEGLTEIGATKTDKSSRLVPIPEDLKPVLRECLARRNNDFIITDYSGNLFEIDQVATYIGNVRKKCGVNFNLYMLRHQFSTDLHNAGIPQNVIRDLMGHESITMTLAYADSKEEDKRAAVDGRKFS